MDAWLCTCISRWIRKRHSSKSSQKMSGDGGGNTEECRGVGPEGGMEPTKSVTLFLFGPRDLKVVPGSSI